MTAHDVVPRANARQWGIDQDEFRDTVRVLSCKGVANHIADVMCDEVGFVDLQCIEYDGNIFGLGLLVVPTGWLRGEAHSAKVRNDDCVVMHQPSSECCPHITGLAITMEQNDCWAIAPCTDINLRAIRGDRLDLELLRKWLDTGQGGRDAKI